MQALQELARCVLALVENPAEDGRVEPDLVRQLRRLHAVQREGHTDALWGYGLGEFTSCAHDKHERATRLGLLHVFLGSATERP